MGSSHLFVKLMAEGRFLPPTVTGVESLVWLLCALIVLAVVLMVRRETKKRRRANRREFDTDAPTPPKR